jgi:hypothetical protein
MASKKQDDSAKHEALEELAVYVRARYKEAFDYRNSSGEYDRMLNCVKQMKGESLISDVAPDGVPDFVLNMSKAVGRSVGAMLKKPFSKTAGIPFLIKSTPLPELSTDAQQKVQNELIDNMDMLVKLAQLDPKMVDEASQEFTATAKAAEDSDAARRDAKLQEKISDITVQAGFLPALNEFLSTMAVFPYAVLKSEYIISKDAVWRDKKIEIVDNVVRKISNIDPFNFYPAPMAMSISAPSAVIERRTITRAGLVGMMNADNYDNDMILEVIEEYPDGHSEPVSLGTEEKGSRKKGTFGLYDVLIMHDFIPGDYLAGLNVDIVNEANFYDVEIWVIAEYPIKVMMNDHPLGHRPYYGTSFSKAKDSAYGDSPVTDMYQVQMMLNSLAKSLIRNVGLTAGVQGEVDVARLDDDTDDDDVLLVTPNKMRRVAPDRYGNGQPAYKFYTLPYIGNQLMQLIDAFTGYIYEIIGIPRFAFGSTEGASTIGRTSSGVAMLLQQAAGTVYDALGNVEVDIIQPLINDLLLDELMNGDDDSIKGDAKVYALALSGLQEKDSKSDKLAWLMQSLSSVMPMTYQDGSPIIPKDAMAKLLYRAFKDAGVDTTGIFPNFDISDALSKDVSHASSPVASHQTDGRTPDNAAQVLEE